MTNQNWVSLLTPYQAAWTGAGTAYSGAATGTISPTPTPNTADYNAYVTAGGFYPGMLIRVLARGYLTTTGTSTTATWLLGSNIGNTGTTYVTLATTTGLTTGTGAIIGLQWKLEALIRCTAVATSGTLNTQGELSFTTAVPAAPAAIAANTMTLPMPNISGETAATVNTLQTQGIALRCTMAAANATVGCTQWLVEALN